MGPGGPASMSVAVIASMVTPALLLLGSVSLVSSALVRMARVVDRSRTLAAVAHDGTWDRLGVSQALLRVWIERHGVRARYVERTIFLLYAAIVVFVTCCLSIPLDALTGGALGWTPAVLAIGGTLMLLLAGAWMVAESRLSGRQIAEEIERALAALPPGGE